MEQGRANRYFERPFAFALHHSCMARKSQLIYKNVCNANSILLLLHLLKIGASRHLLRIHQLTKILFSMKLKLAKRILHRESNKGVRFVLLQWQTVRTSEESESHELIHVYTTGLAN